MINNTINGYMVVAKDRDGDYFTFESEKEFIECYGYDDFIELEITNWYYVEGEELKKINWETIRNGQELYPVIARTQEGTEIGSWSIRNH